MRVNLIGTYNVLEAAHEAGTIERLVDFSTSEVFGTHAYKVEETHVTTQGSVGEARWTYAVSKLAGEYLAHSYFDEFGLPAVVDPAVQRLRARPDRQRRDPPLHRAGAGGRRARDPRRRLADPRLVLRGRHRRGAAQDPRARRGRGRGVQHRQPALGRDGLRPRDADQAAGESDSDIVFKPLHYTDVEMRIPNVDKALKLLEWEPRVDLDDGLARTIGWYRERQPVQSLRLAGREAACGALHAGGLCSRSRRK